MSLETLLEAARFLEQEEQRQKNGVIKTNAGFESISKLYPNTIYSRNTTTTGNESRIAAQSLESLSLSAAAPSVIIKEITSVPIINSAINNHHNTSTSLITTAAASVINTIKSNNEQQQQQQQLLLQTSSQQQLQQSQQIHKQPSVPTPTAIPPSQQLQIQQHNTSTLSSSSSSSGVQTLTNLSPAVLPQSPVTKTRTSSFSEFHEFGNHFLNEDSSSENKRRNGCLLRPGTREVHNKLEKNRRAHLKECFEILKKQLPPQPEEKKTSNLSILHSALRFIQQLRRKEREYEHEMERLAREKIAAQQKLSSLKKELAAQWDHIDFNKLLPNQIDTSLPLLYNNNNGANEVSDNDEISGNGPATYSSPSSLSSATTTSSQSSHVVTIPTGAMSVMQSSNTNTPVVLHAANAITESSTNTTVKPVQANTSTIVHPLHLPLSQVMSAQGFVVSPPTIQLVTGAPGLRVLQSGERQLTLVQASSPDRPLALVQTTAQPHLDLSSTGVTSNPGLQESTVVTTTAPLHKLVSGGVTLMSTSTGNNFRTITKGLTLSNGLSLCSTTVGLASIKKAASSTENTTTGVADIVTSHPPLTGLSPVTPLVVSQGSQLAHIITGTTQINGKVVAPLIKTMSQVPLMSTQYLSTAFMKPEMVVSNSTGQITTSAAAAAASVQSSTTLPTSTLTPSSTSVVVTATTHPPTST